MSLLIFISGAFVYHLIYNHTCFKLSLHDWGRWSETRWVGNHHHSVFFQVRVCRKCKSEQVRKV